MTLYWWMHWFWITALNALLYAHCSFSQTVPTVQNGHQNGPYSETASSADRGQHSRENQQGVNLQNSTVNSTDSSKTQNEQLQTNISLSSELHQYSGPTAATENADGDHTLPSVLNLPVDLLHLEAKVKTHDYSQFPQVNGHESYEQNWDHFAAPQWDTSSVPYKEEQDNITSSVVSANPVSDDEPMKGNISKSQSSIHEMNASEDQPVNDAPQSDAMDVFNMSDGITANVKKTPAVANSTTDGSPVNKPAGYNYRGKYVNMEKKMQEKPRNMTSLKLKTGSTPIVYVTPTSMKIVTEVMRESEEENVTESTNHVGGMILSKDNISITLPMDESVASVTADPNIRNLATTENHTNNDSVLNAVSRERIGQSNDTQGLDAASITGIALGILASAVLVGAVSVILYRRRYLNKPQTLNDSNPDSSGYLDENTLRENSEEMYSLDNDSFLNSLEAMTIQNYWTDSVKHTKL